MSECQIKMNIYDNCILIHYINEKITTIADIKKTGGLPVVFGPPQAVKPKIIKSEQNENLLDEIKAPSEENLENPGSGNVLPEIPQQQEIIQPGPVNNEFNINIDSQSELPPSNVNNQDAEIGGMYQPDQDLFDIQETNTKPQNDAKNIGSEVDLLDMGENVVPQPKKDID